MKSFIDALCRHFLAHNRAYGIVVALVVLAITRRLYLASRRRGARRVVKNQHGVSLSNQSYVNPKDKPQPGHGEVHYSPLATDVNKLIATHPNYQNVKTMYDAFMSSVKNYPDHKYLGQRYKVVADDGTTMMGPYSWLTYREAFEKAQNFGSGLKNLLGFKTNDFIGIYSINRTEWVLTDRACDLYNFISVPLYDTLGTEAVEYIINHCQLTTIVASPEHVPALVALITSDKCPSLKTIIQMDYQQQRQQPQQQQRQQRSSSSSKEEVKVYMFTEVEEAGRKNLQPHVPPKSTDLLTICFTSGTTGTPKGAMITHGNIVADMGSALYCILSFLPTDVHVSYLPLSHMLERVIMSAMTLCGAAVGFYQGNVLKLFEDIATLKPTVFVSVPRLFNKLYDKVTSSVNAAGGLKKKLFNMALETKVRNLKQDGSLHHFVYDALVFKKVRSALGGRVRIMVTGSAPISEQVMNFLRVAFSCIVVEGYGMTECTAAATMTDPLDIITGHVGAPLPCGAIKLVDVPEMNYFVTDTPCPRGEVCFYGTNVFQGYYNDEERTKEAFPDGDGWLHSGDIGMWLPNGTLKIIDRRKNIFKLAQGEYVAPEKLENIYVRSSLVAQCFVYGDSSRHALVAVVVPDPETVIPWARTNLPAAAEGQNSTELMLQQLCKSKELRKAILEEMRAEGKKANLAGFELVHAIHLHPEMFSIENDILTPTFKLKRNVATHRFQEELAKLYSEMDEASNSN